MKKIIKGIIVLVLCFGIVGCREKLTPEQEEQIERSKKIAEESKKLAEEQEKLNEEAKKKMKEIDPYYDPK